jgi:hypothetical protein
MRTFVAMSVILLAQPVWAAAEDDKAFQKFVTATATENTQWIEQWWVANLDADPAPERVALLCPKGAEDHKGAFVIEKDAAHRWEIPFDVDKRTKACTGKPGAEPKLETRKTTTVDLYQGHLNGYEIHSYALRVGQPVIVRQEQVVDSTVSPKPVVVDWDLLIKKKKEKNYQVPENLRQLN